MTRGAAVLLGLALPLAACAPLTVSRIGPWLDPRPAGCAIEVLDRGEVPARPYRDVGLVTIENCQDYRTDPCRGWLEEAACGIGGQIAYVSEERRPDPGLAPLRAQVLVAVYVADLRPDPQTDPMLRSRTCDPPCAEGTRCVNRECVAGGGPDCAAGGAPKPESQAPEKCRE